MLRTQYPPQVSIGVPNTSSRPFRVSVGVSNSYLVSIRVTNTVSHPDYCTGDSEKGLGGNRGSERRAPAEARRGYETGLPLPPFLCGYSLIVFGRRSIRPSLNFIGVELN